MDLCKAHCDTLYHWDSHHSWSIQLVVHVWVLKKKGLEKLHYAFDNKCTYLLVRIELLDFLHILMDSCTVHSDLWPDIEH